MPATDTASTAAGLNMQMDQDTAADLGWELNFGSPMGGNTAFTVGTHAGYIDLSVFVADWTEYDVISVGFRKVQPVETGHAPIIGAGTGDPVYTDFVTFGIQDSMMLVQRRSTKIRRQPQLTPKMKDSESQYLLRASLRNCMSKMVLQMVERWLSRPDLHPRILLMMVMWLFLTSQSMAQLMSMKHSSSSTLKWFGPPVPATLIKSVSQIH